ncbi:2-dehydro-3-deoxygalactonokinase (2-keto-3-deoxy-galactonokinase) (2-oxo-3-deoxygalactonate kinase) [Hymenobacter roseosalivarius DSM 11622]|uniref:2-dehydro-3-deoxygalactonokinase (2-keto-3-deoxy-galactonokinase) (2-oxo-3-deoxygalactonate kinase) n=1 Tax=Hymenobacter roseosalivarius DSM 11622 TaxID=645990 RepID=A0A1W1UIP5_9BACT|nr:2-dehydro-3-deoxygalactonokinase [Hymenobacter roseosalivarius]SMB80909.1 2-dehydro-3-deoxygalactonokinase (2-keto-3-deoxy-galactonokinase) (2-oxo-3-deoxygalactonate kinase) [Hymenobacter roseosalivarius DSM 11622]
MNPQTTFLSCDWGTSSFRLRLVECEGLNVLAKASSKEGNAATAELWQQAQQPPEQRLGFYLAILQKHLNTLEEAVETSLHEVPVVVSGMASSTVGMMELPYKPLPFATDGSDLTTEILEPTNDFKHPVLLVSGIKSKDDVMRGEEVQLVGCRFETTAAAQLFLHPGTHAKHVLVRDGRAVSFKTYMTGELFSLLSKKSILAVSVEEGGHLGEGNNRQWFEKGVQASQRANLLHNAFLVRTNDLFKKASKQENYFYLSGLVIGSECQDLLNNLPASIMLAGEAVLLDHYSAALRMLGIADKCPIETKMAVEVTLGGQLAVLNHSALHQPHAQ